MGDCLQNRGFNTPYELLKISLAKNFPTNCRSKCFITFLSKTSMVKYFFRKVADNKYALVLKIHSTIQ